jgi:hypothetical protein
VKRIRAATRAALYIILLNIAYLYKILCNLYGIKSGSLADLVATEPECKTVLIADVLAHTTYVYIVLACCLERHGVGECGGIVLECAARSGGDGLLSLLYADGALGLDPYTL